MKENTGYLDKLRQEVFVGDELYSEEYRQYFTAGVTMASFGKVYWLRSRDKRLDFGLSKAKDMTKIYE